MNNKKLKKINKGFTIIETLVAITILMIAIAGPLTVATKGYTSSLDAKNQSIAINLAQEGLEYLNNQKDNQNLGWGKDIPFFNNSDISYSGCKIKTPCNFDRFITPSQSFERKFYIEQFISNPNQIAVNVEVAWRNGDVINSVTLEQILTNYER